MICNFPTCGGGGGGGGGAGLGGIELNFGLEFEFRELEGL